MKNFIKSFRITIAFCIFFSVFYILVLWIFAQFAGRGENGNAETVTLNGKVVGAANVGQMFTSDVYFWGRPSSAGAEMVTASGSGLDPNITPACAYVQVKRVAEARGMSEDEVKAIVDQAVEKPLLGMFGTAKVNVLKLNVALDEANK